MASEKPTFSWFVKNVGNVQEKANVKGEVLEDLIRALARQQAEALAARCTELAEKVEVLRVLLEEENLRLKKKTSRRC